MSETAIEVRDLCIDYIPYKKKSIQKSFLKKNTAQAGRDVRDI